MSDKSKKDIKKEKEKINVTEENVTIGQEESRPGIGYEILGVIHPKK